MTALELAILKSVVYASLFDYPLTAEQVQRTLVECTATTSEILAAWGRSPALASVLECRDGFFFPIGRGDLVAERHRREARSLAFLDRHASVLRLICALPFVRMVALSGSIAHHNLEPDGDLDLFIVTRGHHVWTVTLSIVLLTKLLRRRGTICANFVVADSELTFEQQDLFTANQIIHLKPLVGEGLMAEIVAANPFVSRFYPNAVLSRQTENDERRTASSRSPFFVLGSTFVERASRSLYGWYLRRKARGWRSPEQVRLGADCLKLHTRSHRGSITGRFESAVARAVAMAEAAAEPAFAAAGGGRRARR